MIHQQLGVQSSPWWSPFLPVSSRLYHKHTIKSIDLFHVSTTKVHKTSIKRHVPSPPGADLTAARSHGSPLRENKTRKTKLKKEEGACKFCVIPLSPFMEALHVEARCNRKRNRISPTSTQRDTFSLPPTPARSPAQYSQGKRKAKVPKMTKGKIGKTQSEMKTPPRP